MASTGSTRGYNQGGIVTHYDDYLNPEHQTDLWRTCPILPILSSPKIAAVLDENWQDYNATDTYTLTQATTGAAAISTAAAGTLELDSNSSTATQGAQIQRLVSAFVPASGKDIWFEARIKIVDTYDKCELFVGLCASDTTIIATSAVSTNNHIGWKCVTDDGVLLFTCDKAATGTTAAAATIAEATYIDLGFHYDGTADTVQQYINGVATGSAIATTYIPKVVIYPSFVCQSGGTNDPIMHIQGYRVIQLK